MRRKIITLLLLATLSLIVACAGKQEIPIDRYYEYDFSFPLEDSVWVEKETDRYITYYVTYRSVHESIVTGLLTIPKNIQTPMPAIIFVHGIGDYKDRDYMEWGHKYMVDSSYAVLRIDVANHGDRKIHDYDYDFVEGYRYWTRNMITQTVFDLRRAVDFLGKRPEIDSNRLGYFGISLGGIIGTVFCGVDKRIKVPVIALAGGGLNLVFKLKAFSEETKIYFSIFDPINFVDKISPRPLLMLNASNDEVVPPITSKLMYKKAGEPKKIIWYPTKHRRVPQDEVYPEGIRWFKKHL
ncbi:acetylxylan esterase [candidate division KSB1 bacterium]|nr:acetylxylan esterase [candidate division KSB1 bacterium]